MKHRWEKRRGAEEREVRSGKSFYADFTDRRGF